MLSTRIDSQNAYRYTAATAAVRQTDDLGEEIARADEQVRRTRVEVCTVGRTSVIQMETGMLES